MQLEYQHTLLSRVFGRTGLIVFAVAVFVFFSVPMTIADPDIWWHLRNAEYLVTTHHMITRDMFSFTAANARWMNHEWLADLPYYAGWRLLGAKGVYLVSLATIEAIMLGIFCLAYRRCHNALVAFVITCAASILCTVSYGPRTLLFGWLLLVAELAILDLSDEWPRVVLLLPLLFGLWVNTHGSWMIGLVLLCVYIAAQAIPFRLGAIVSPGLDPERLHLLLLSAGASVAALFVNPYGWRLVVYPIDLAFHQKLNVANVQEWFPLDFHSPRGKITLICIALMALWQLWKNREWRTSDLAFLAIGLYSALNYSRFLFLFCILAAPAAATLFRKQKVPAVAQAPRYALNAAVMFLLACFVYGRAAHAKPVALQGQDAFPGQALDYLSSHPLQGPVFNEYLWGGYLIWHERALPVFIDPRADIFEYNGTFKDYLDIVRLNDTKRLLDKYRVQYVLFEPNTPLVYFLEQTGGWKVDFTKGSTVLLERTGPVPH